MNPIEPKVEAGKVVEVSWADRWQVYHRLQELEIESECASNQPLRVEVDTVTAAIQLWSVVRQLSTPRRDLVEAIERCWQIHFDPKSL